MKRFALMLLVALAFAPACIGFDYVTNTCTITSTTTPGQYNDFAWRWSGYDDQRVVLNVATPPALSNVYLRLAYPRRGTVFLDVLGTGTGTTRVFSVARTNLPPAGRYFAEFLNYESAYTNIPTRVVANGSIRVEQSVWQSTTQSTWTNPLAGTVLGPPIHTLTNMDDWGFVLVAGDAMTGPLTNLYGFVGDGSGLTGVTATADIVAGTGITITTNETDQQVIALYAGPEISAFTLGGSSSATQYREAGNSLTSGAFAWTLAGATPTFQRIVYGTTTGNVAVGTTSTNWTFGSPITSGTTFTLSVGDGTSTDTSSRAVAFRYRRYWGWSAETSLADEDAIEALTGSDITATTGVKSQISITAPGSQYFYYAYPSAWADIHPQFADSGYEVGGPRATNSVENAYGTTADYRVIRSINPLTAGSWDFKAVAQ